MLADPDVPKEPATAAEVAAAVAFARERGALALDSVPLEVLESVLAHQGLVLDLLRVATGGIPHAYNGLCPEAVEGAEVRDPDCPACRVLMAADKSIAATTPREVPECFA